jgi:hypothetical protein
MEQFSNWIEKTDPDLCEGLGILRIIKQMIPGGGMTIMKGRGPGMCMRGMKISQQSQTAIIKGTGPNKESALQNALEKLDCEPKDVELIDKDNDIYTFRVEI